MLHWGRLYRICAGFSAFCRPWPADGAGRPDIAIERRTRHAQGPDDLFDVDGGVLHQVGCHLHLFRRHAPRASAQPAVGTGRMQPSHRAVADQIALKLRQRGEDVKLELAHGTGGVDAFVQAAEPDLALLQIFHLLYKVLERAPQAIQAPDDQGVAGAHEGESRLQARSLGLGAAHLVGEDLRAAGLLERVGLEIEILFAGGDAGVAYEHGVGGELVGGMG